MKPRAASRAPISGVDFGAYLRAEASLFERPERARALALELGLGDETALRDVVHAWQRRIATEPALEAAYALYRDERVPPLPPASSPVPDTPAPEPLSGPQRVEVPSYLQAPEIDIDATQPPLRRAGATLPFARGGDVPDAVRAAWAEAKAEARAAREERESSDAADAQDETAFLPRSALARASTPFEKTDGEAPAAPAMPMEQYAKFLAELAQDPGRAGFMRAKYGIEGEDAQRALGGAFAAIFQRDPSERARFDRLVATERARLSTEAASPSERETRSR